MAKRSIGIDIDLQSLRVAVLRQDKGQIIGLELFEASAEVLDEQLAEVSERLTAEIRLGDRLATSLPAARAFVRRLTFPFAAERKIAAALPFELAAQLPVPLEDCTTAMLITSSKPEETAVLAAAVPTAILETFLEPFDQAGLPLHILDLAPFGSVAGLGKQIDTGLLVCLNLDEIWLARISEGELVDYRLHPGTSALDEKTLTDSLARELLALGKAADRPDLPAYLMGSGATPELVNRLTDQGQSTELLTLVLGGEQIPARFGPAAALALRAAQSGREQGFNLRQGSFALKGEWAGLKKKLVLVSVLLGLTLLTLLTSAIIGYRDRNVQAEALNQEMTRVYRETFPGSATIVDIPLQMQAGVAELRRRGEQIGSGGQPTPLAVLKELAKLPKENRVEVREFSYTPGEVRLSGQTESFEAVNRIAESLKESATFAEVQIADSRMSLQGDQVEFRFLLTPAAGRQP